MILTSGFFEELEIIDTWHRDFKALTPKLGQVKTVSFKDFVGEKSINMLTIAVKHAKKKTL